MSHDTAFLTSLGLDDDQVSHAEADRTEHAHDWGTARDDGVAPDVVVWPECTEDVAAVVRAANEWDVPVTPYAAGTSLEGNAVPVEGGVSLDMRRMDDVIDVRPDDLQVDVGPGILGSEVNEAVERYGLFLPSLPSSGRISTIGGMLANDASGMKTVKYGEVSDWLLEVEAVLPTGEVITAGIDILPALKGEDSTKWIFRLRVSSVPKYAFAWNVEGCHRVVTNGVRCSACSPVNGAFLPASSGRRRRLAVQPAR